MSGKKNETKADQKVMTKYDQKMQQRKEAAEQAKKEEKRGLAVGIALVLLLAAFVASFPIRSYLAVNGAYIKVGNEKVTQLEFGMQYNVTKDTYVEQMRYYLELFGMTDLTNIEYQTYSGDMTFGDYFMQLTAEGIVEQKGIKAKAKEAGFTYDTTEELAEMKTALETAAKEVGVTFDNYIQTVYGSLATWNRIVPYLEESLYVSAYYNQVLEDSMPSEEAIAAEYDSNKNAYDSVDYHYIAVDAELPKTAPDGTVQKDENGNEIAYTPTEEEVAAAMKAAYLQAQEKEKVVATEGEAYENIKLSDLSSTFTEFMASEDRKPGDTTIIELESLNRYLVVSFDGRHRDDTPTHDMRMIITMSADSKVIMEEWAATERTEEDFMALVTKYDEMGMESYGGYYTGLELSEMDVEIAEWMQGGREKGDTYALTNEVGETYVLYYIKENEAGWKLDATNNIVNAAMTAFMEEATAGIEIVDKDKHLSYLEKQDAE